MVTAFSISSETQGDCSVQLDKVFSLQSLMPRLRFALCQIGPPFYFKDKTLIWPVPFSLCLASLFIAAPINIDRAALKGGLYGEDVTSC